MIEADEKKALLWIVVGALVLRLVLLFALGAHQIDDDWRFGYETGRVARALAEGEGFSSPFRQPSGPTAWLMPAYPALLALIFVALGTYSVGSAVAILVINCIFGALTCAAVYLLAREIFGRATATLSAIVFALYPPSIWHSINSIWDTSLLTLVVVLLIYGLYRMPDDNRRVTFIAYGIALGLAVWVNPVILSILPVIWWRLWRRSRGPLSQRLEAVVLVTLVMVVVVTPWVIRNHRQFGRLYLRSNLGLELMLGNSDAAWEDYLAGSLSSTWARRHPSVVPEELQRFVSMGEEAYVEEAMGEALAFIVERPGKFARLTVNRVYHFWLSDLKAKSEWSGNLAVSVSLSWMKKASHLVPMLFIVLGLAIAVKKRRDIGPLIGTMVLFPAVYYITNITERYRFPIEPFLVILASVGLLWVVARTGLWPGGSRFAPVDSG
ncbi:MAG: glycosyltransferase family 39 protein [Thermoanaerobaculia bacterium]